ncbi:extracellular solute-binding protein [bacterium]|nr:extracellular solute-binding protein [bacterium]
MKRLPAKFAAIPVLLGLALLGAVLLPGCGHVDRSRAVIVWEQMDPGEQDFFDAHVAEFRQRHPEFADFAIERVHYRVEDLQTQFQTAALAYGGPNLVYGPADKVGPYSIMGLLMPVEELLPQAEIDRFTPDALPVLAGHVYGLPDQVGNHLTLVANLALVDSVAVDTDTWLEQLRAATVDRDGDGKPDQYGLVFNLLEPFWLVPWLGGFGGWVMDDALAPTLDTPAMTGALQFLSDLKRERVVPLECDYPLADTIFKEGRAAYIINGPWSWQGYREAGLDIALAPIPMVSATGLWPAPMTSAKCYSVNRYLDPATRECTAALLQWLTSAEVQTNLARGLGVMPADMAAARNPEIQADPAQVASRRQIEKGRLMPIVPEMRAIWDAMRPAYQSVMNGELAPADAAREMQQRAATMIERMRE